MPSSSGTRWVTFDCFGTLVDWQSGFEAILRPMAQDKTKELLRAYHQIEPLVEAERPHLLYKDVLTRALWRAAREIGMNFTESQARLLPDKWASLPLFPDVEDALAGLRAAGYKLAVLTNCDDDLFALTQRSFRAPFDLVITAEQVGAYKPALDHFQYFARVSGVASANWVHVASSLFHDIAPARELGIKSIWLDRENSSEPSGARTFRILTAKGLPGAVTRVLSGP